MLLQPLSDRAGSGVAPSERQPAVGRPITESETEEPSGTASERLRKPRKRRLLLFIGVILCVFVLLFAIVVGVMLFLARDTSSPYRVGQALEQFKLLQRRDESSTIAASAGLPVTGVYMYTTTGSESANAPGLPASGAQYPGTTAVTVLTEGCGEDWRWQPLTDRYEDLEVCRSSNGSLMLQSRFDAVQFYRDNDRRKFACTPTSVYLPAHPRSGQTFGGKCNNDGNANSGGLAIGYSGEVVGEQTLEVDGVIVPTVHIALTEQMSGDTVGTGTESLWLDSETGLVVRENRTEKTRSQSAVGWVPSTESLSLELVSVNPKR